MISLQLRGFFPISPCSNSNTSIDAALAEIWNSHSLDWLCMTFSRRCDPLPSQRPPGTHLMSHIDYLLPLRPPRIDSLLVSVSLCLLVFLATPPTMRAIRRGWGDQRSPSPQSRRPRSLPPDCCSYFRFVSQISDMLIFHVIKIVCHTSLTALLRYDARAIIWQRMLTAH